MMTFGTFDWSYTPSPLTIINVHPDFIHRKHCPYMHSSMKILFIATLLTNNTNIIHNIHIGVNFFLLSKFLPINVR